MPDRIIDESLPDDDFKDLVKDLKQTLEKHNISVEEGEIDSIYLKFNSKPRKHKKLEKFEE